MDKLTQHLNDQLYARRALRALLSDVLPGGHSPEPIGPAAERRIEALQREIEALMRRSEVA